MVPLRNCKFDLRNKYEKYFKISIIITLLFVIAAFKFSPKTVKTEIIKTPEPDIIQVENVLKQNRKVIYPISLNLLYQ